MARTGERDLIPMASEMGLGVLPWAPLGNGVLTGKYMRADLTNSDYQTGFRGTRKSVAAAYGSISERTLAIADLVVAIAAETGHSAAQIAIAWTLLNPAVAPLLGARTAKQLEDNLGALDVSLADEHRARLHEASAVALGFPHDLLRKPMIIQGVTGGLDLPERAW
jgi:aryl-alcohol dehydrogenase-like predicted oxidoreductase